MPKEDWLGGPKNLQQCVPHRWNYLYLMFERVKELRYAFNLFCLEEKRTEPLVSEDWALMNCFLDALKPLYDITIELSLEKHSTVSKMMKITSELYDQKARSEGDNFQKIFSSIQKRN